MGILRKTQNVSALNFDPKGVLRDLGAKDPRPQS